MRLLLRASKYEEQKASIKRAAGQLRFSWESAVISVTDEPHLSPGELPAPSPMMRHGQARVRTEAEKVLAPGK
jgi:hypothetical protein